MRYLMYFLRGGWCPPACIDEETEAQSQAFDQAKRHIRVHINECVAVCVHVHVRDYKGLSDSGFKARSLP